MLKRGAHPLVRRKLRSYWPTSEISIKEAHTISLHQDAEGPTVAHPGPEEGMKTEAETVQQCKEDTCKPEHKKRYKEPQKVQQSLCHARWRYIKRILQAGLDEGSSEPFWNYIRSQKQDHAGVSPLKTNGQLHPDSTTKCDIIADQFKSVFTKDLNDTHHATKLYGPSHPQITELIIQEEGIQKLLDSVNPSKASGPDEMRYHAASFVNSQMNLLLSSHVCSSKHTLVENCLHPGPLLGFHLSSRRGQDLTHPTTDQFHWPV